MSTNPTGIPTTAVTDDASDLASIASSAIMSTDSHCRLNYGAHVIKRGAVDDKHDQWQTKTTHCMLGMLGFVGL